MASDDDFSASSEEDENEQFAELAKLTGDMIQDFMTLETHRRLVAHEQEALLTRFLALDKAARRLIRQRRKQSLQVVRASA